MPLLHSQGLQQSQCGMRPPLRAGPLATVGVSVYREAGVDWGSCTELTSYRSAKEATTPPPFLLFSLLQSRSLPLHSLATLQSRLESCRVLQYPPPTAKP